MPPRWSFSPGNGATRRKTSCKRHSSNWSDGRHARRRGGVALSRGAQQSDHGVRDRPSGGGGTRPRPVAHRPAAFVRSAADRIDAGVAAAALDSLSIELREVVVARIWGGLTFRTNRPVGRRFRQCRPSALRSGPIGLATETEGAMSEERLERRTYGDRSGARQLDARAERHRPRPADVPGGNGVGFWSAAIHRRFFLGDGCVVRHCRTAPTKAAMNRRTPKFLWPIVTAASLVAAATFGILWAEGTKPQIASQAAGVSVANSSPAIDSSRRPIAALALVEPASVPVGARKRH